MRIPTPLPLLLLSSLVMASCGIKTVKVSTRPMPDAARIPTRAAEARPVELLALEVESVNAQDGATSASPLLLHTKVGAPRFSEATQKVELPKVVTHVVVRDATGKIVFQESKKGGNFNWEIAVDGEGDYEMEVRAEHPNRNVFPTPPVWRSKVRVDKTPPSLSATARLETDALSGARKARVNAVLAGETEGQCEMATIRKSGEPQGGLATTGALVRKGFSQGEGLTFASEAIEVPVALGNAIVADVRCHDKAGNQAQVIVPVGKDDVALVGKAELVAPFGNIVESGENAYMVRPGSVTIRTALAEPVTGQAAAPSVVEREWRAFRVYVSEKEPTGLEDLLTHRSAFSYAWAPEIVFPLSDGLLGRKRIFVSFTRGTAGREALVNTVALTIFVDHAGPALSWVSRSQFVPARKGQEIFLELKLESAGSPLAQTPRLESTTNGTEWSPLELSHWRKIDGTTNGFSLVYPFDEERPFRVRLVARDLAGNETVSSPSPNLVGPAGLAEGTTDAARQNCRGAGGAPASRLVPLVASRILCRLRDSNGALTGNYAVSLILANHGQAAVFPAGDGVNMGARLLTSVEGPDRATWFELPREKFQLPAAQQRLVVHVPLSESHLDSPTLEAQFDILETLDAKRNYEYSTPTGSTCYARDGATRPGVVIKGNGETLVRGPFGCDSAE